MWVCLHACRQSILQKVANAVLTLGFADQEERPAITERSPDVALFEGEAKIDSAGAGLSRNPEHVSRRSEWVPSGNMFN